MFRFSDITHALILRCFAHAVSRVSHTCNFSALIHFQIPHKWTVSDTTNILFFRYNNRMHCLKILCPSRLSAITRVPFLRYRACAASPTYRTCVFCNISRVGSPQLSHTFSFQVPRVYAVFCVLSSVSIHFNAQFHGNVKWWRTKALQILGLSPNETELSMSQTGPFTSGELTPVRTRLATGLVLELSWSSLAESFFLFK